MKRISFLMPTFNRAHLIGESLASVFAVLGPDDEVIVINDGSTDDTLAAVAASGVPHRYLEQNNSGKAVALNLGLAAAKGEFIWICDDDDLLVADAVEPLYAALKSAPDIDWVFGRYERFLDTGDRRVALDRGYWPSLEEGALVRHVLEDMFVMQNATLVRSTAYRAVGGFSPDQLRSVDYDMAIRLALSQQGRFVDHVVYRQREHAGVRGPAGDLRPAAKSVDGWREYDRRIFARLRAALPLTAYESFFEGPLVLRRRSALLQRGCVEARHDRWDCALDDWEMALQINAGPLDSGERAICRRAFEGKHGFGQGFDHSAVARLKRLHRETQLGRSMVEEMLRGTTWRLRCARTHTRANAWKLFITLLGFFKTAALLLRFVFDGRDERAPQVSESNCPPLFNVDALAPAIPKYTASGL